ncbi:MAG: hypothetical protein J7M40_02625 [Planctomycetes bacterium]|nr:hypothetical protein [Planctomycetota bacterium]
MDRFMPFGKPDEVAKQAKWLCGNIGKDGGFILSTCNMLTNIIPTGNVYAMYGVK